MTKLIPELQPIPGKGTNRKVFVSLRLRVIAWLDGLPIYTRTMMWLLPTLFLCINGGTQAQLPTAFAGTGVAAATVFMVVTAAVNMYTSHILCYQAYYCGVCDYETLGYAVGGRFWKAFTEFSVFALLFGTLVYSWITQGQTMGQGILFINPNAANTVGWLINGSGRLLMLFSLLAVLPALFFNKWRKLEAFADISAVFIIVTMVWLMVYTIKHHFQYLGSDGNFPYSGFISQDEIAGAISILGFAFYLQPLLMPMLPEMPAGKLGPRILSTASLITIGGTGFIVYYICGFFGASAFGALAVATGNFLANNMGGGVAQGVLNIVYSVALLPAIPPFEFGARHALDSFICSWLNPSFVRRFHKLRNFILAGLTYSVSIALAEIFAGQVAQAVQWTSAIGVLLVSYFIPVVNHFLLLFGYAGVQRHRDWMDHCPKSVSVILTEAEDDKAAAAAAAHTDSDTDTSTAPLTAPLTALTQAQALADIRKKNAAAALEKPLQVDGEDPLKVNGEVRDGALDYDYRFKLSAWSIFFDILCPLFVLAYGLWASIATLRLVTESTAASPTAAPGAAPFGSPMVAPAPAP